MLLCVVGCGDDGMVGGDAGPSYDIPTTTVSLLLTGIAREDAEGRLRGVDLDRRISDRTDELGCFQNDWTDPITGAEGVDDQYYSLAVTVEAQIGGPNIDEVIREAAVVVPLTMASAPGGVEVRLGDVEPQVVPITGGHFQALTEGSFLLGVDGSFPIVVHQLAVDALVSPEGALTSVVIAGAIDIDQTVAAVERDTPAIDPSLVRTTLEGVADLDPGPDGACRKVSAVFTAEVEPAP